MVVGTLRPKPSPLSRGTARVSFTRLLRWYDKHGRDLPWRKTKQAYRILISEIMLQQTQVPRVLLFYQSWLRRFPNWSALADASTAELLRAWAGLGYNRRALALREIARFVVKNGEPKSEEAWLELKGIGPYTAAALAAFSLRQATVPIDTNIRRVLGRFLLGRAFPQPGVDPSLKKRALPTLQKMGRFSDVPQALFDLATNVCKKDPDCAACPLRLSCLAAPKFLSGRVRVPKRMIRKSRERIHRDKRYPDRIYRGRILALVRTEGMVALKKLGSAIDEGFQEDRDKEWLRAMVIRLSKDGMIDCRGGYLSLADG